MSSSVSSDGIREMPRPTLLIQTSIRPKPRAPIDDARDLAAPRHVGDDRLRIRAARGSDLGELFLAPRDQHDLAAPAGQQSAVAPADAGARAGDDDDFVGHVSFDYSDRGLTAARGLGMMGVVSY